MAANADIIMTITDDGTDLTMTATGTYDNTGLPAGFSVSLGTTAIVGPNQCCYGWETGVTAQNYSATYSGSLTGTSNALAADLVSTMNPFFFWHASNRIVFKQGAALVGSVNESATWFGVTLASLGMVAGESIQVTWGGNTAIIQTFAISVPEPGTIALLGIGLLSMGIARRRKA